MATTVSDEAIALARANLFKGKFPEIKLESVEQRLAEYKCSPKYPEDVAHNIMLARELCVAGSVFYELFTVALHYTAVAAETALKALFLERLDLPFTMKRTVNGKAERKVFTERPPLYEFSHMGWKLVGPLGGKARNLASLISWADETSLITSREVRTFEAGRRTRNLTAHGHNMVGMWNWAFAAVRNTTLIFNRLFPDPETTAYDEGNRRREEERMRAYDLALDQMLRLPDEPQDDS